MKEEETVIKTLMELLKAFEELIKIYTERSMEAYSLKLYLNSEYYQGKADALELAIRQIRLTFNIPVIEMSIL